MYLSRCVTYIFVAIISFVFSLMAFAYGCIARLHRIFMIIGYAQLTRCLSFVRRPKAKMNKYILTLQPSSLVETKFTCVVLIKAHVSDENECIYIEDYERKIHEP